MNQRQFQQTGPKAWLQRAIASTSVVALFAAPITTGCVAGESLDSIELTEIEVVERSFSSSQVAALSADAKFVELLQTSVDMIDQALVANSKRSNAQLAQYITTVGDPEYIETANAFDILALSGVEKQLLYRHWRLTAQLLELHQLSNMNAAQVGALFSAASKTTESQSFLEGSIENSLHDIGGDYDPDPNTEPCLTLCTVAMMVGTVLAGTAFIVAIAQASALTPGAFVFPPLAVAVVVLVIIATATFLLAMANIAKAFNQCVDDCNA